MSLSFSVGIDIVNIPRFKALLQAGSISPTVFSQQEIVLRIESLAGNFAVKESFIKAFHGTIPAFDLSTLEVLRNSMGVPVLKTVNPVLLSYTRRVISISMSHDVDYCFALVVAQQE
jgi:holo-[acyl-carrier protein] synthase